MATQGYVRLGCGYVSLGCGYARLGCGYASLGCVSVRLGCGYVRLGCGYARLGCGYARLGCGYAMLGWGGVCLLYSVDVCCIAGQQAFCWLGYVQVCGKNMRVWLHKARVWLHMCVCDTQGVILNPIVCRRRTPLSLMTLGRI